MNTEAMEFSPVMITVIILAFFAISFFMGMMVHSSVMYEDKPNLDRNSKKAWALCMVAGVGITGWMFAYGYYVNFGR
ncbi:MAG: hypothetical protein KC553_05165 [Nitrospina sp.]|nr:hypothetical protein [Nitrospina sp.]